VSFISLKFAVCLVIGLVLFHSAPARWRANVLLGLSVAFYATWSAWHALLLFGIVAIVYGAAIYLERTSEQKTKFRTAILTVTALLLLLTVFKCGQLIAGQIAVQWRESRLDAFVLLAAPLGLSYYLFKLLGYLLDVYWEKMPAQKDFAALALYAAFFPQLICGPIQRADDFFEQLPRISTSDPDQFVQGLRRILFGMFKKVVIADQLAVAVTHLHADPIGNSSAELLLGAYCFSLQMYADFSGITDIAIGIGQLFGIKGPENFDRPYFARNVQEFWRRWHMSLTSWLTDYLFLPLRMALRNFANTGLVIAIFVNMIAVAVWHGPRWSYVAFGCINGLFVAVSALTLKKRNAFFKRHASFASARNVAATLITFHMVVLTHIFFQAPDLSSALSYLQSMAAGLASDTIPATRLDWTIIGLSPLRFALALAGLAVAETVHWGVKNPAWVTRYVDAPRFVRWGFSYALLVLVILSERGTTSFIYAQF
jgi:D-alanyl-lipoteichoic acid acyltransferase DltB (MBOAT superfamily)